MKKFTLLLLPLLLIIALLACESTGTDNNSKKDNDADSSEITSSSVSSNSEASSSEADDSQNDNNSDSTSTPNGSQTKTFDNVQVTLKGEDALKSAGFRVGSASDLTVQVTVTGPADVIGSVTALDITAEVDVSGIAETGEVDMMVTYSLPAGLKRVDPSDDFVKLVIKSASAEITPPPATGVRIVNGIIISGTRAMEQFGGGSSAGASTAAKLNTFKQAVGDVNVYILPAPLASAFYAPTGYEKSIKNHQNCFYGMRDALSGVKFVDTLSALAPHVGEDIYFRTDHHWQALGAYYCAEELASVAGVPFAKLTSFTAHSENGMLGSFYTSYTNKDSVLKNNPDTMTWYVPSASHTVTYYSRSNFKNPLTGRTLFSTNSGYTKFIYGDSYTTHIQSSVGNGRKLLLFKDSYGNALAPFLVSSFDEVYVADYRYFALNAKDFIKEHGITDVCFEMAAFSVAGSKRNYITQLLD